MKGVYTNKAPGGVAYACSFRVTEAAYVIERMIDVLAVRAEGGPGRAADAEPAAARAVPVPQPDRLGVRLRRLPAHAAAGAGHGRLRRAARASRPSSGERSPPAEGDGVLTGIGLSFFTEAVGAGPRKHMDILGLGMADGAELRVHPTGKAVLRISVQSQGQGHETTFAQIVAEELGISPDDIEVVHGDTDQTPFGLGTYGSRSTPVSGAATAVVARKVRDRAKIVASAMLEVSAGRPGVGEGPLVRQGRPGQGQDDPGDRAGRARLARAARGRRGAPGRDHACTTRRT